MSVTLVNVKKPVMSRASAYLDWLQMLSGLFLVLFMVFHMTFVSTVNFGAGAFNAMAHFLEGGGMANIEVPLIGFVFLLHFVLAARKIPFVSGQQAILIEHARRFAHLDTWLWVVQAATAMIILIMGGVHIWAVFADMPVSAVKSAARIQQPAWFLFYLVLLPMIELHVGIGVYRVLVKWGIVPNASRVRLRTYVFYFIGAMVFIGLVTLTRFALLKI